MDLHLVSLGGPPHWGNGFHSILPAIRRQPFILPLMLFLAAELPAAFHFFDPREKESVPRLLSQTGVYSEIATKVTDTSLKYFEINSPLWSDGAVKHRWIILPPNQHIVYQDSTDLFDYPDSTVFVKNFLLERVSGDSNSLAYWETRLLMNRKDASGQNDWYGFSYKWNAAATEAYLVDSDLGFDTAFYYNPEGRTLPQSYKKWRFPSQEDCRTCHRARHVLGFLPAQLKRPAPKQPSIDQIADLFRQGVFTGTAPAGDLLRKRWKGMGEPIPTGLSPEQRFAVVDSMSRSYLAANCSGCHGDRGFTRNAAPSHINFDFFRLYPAMELGHAETNPLNLAVDSAGSAQAGRLYFIDAVVRAGFDTAVGKDWNMAPPTGAEAATLLYPGNPSYSTLLYRQLVRKTPARDSQETRQYLELSGDPEGWLSWMFSTAWGSEAWRQSLEAHGVDARRVMMFEKDGGQLGGQMPPLTSSFIPDRQAMAILGEWVKGYRTLRWADSGTGIRGGFLPGPAGRTQFPRLLGRILIVPFDFAGVPLLLDIHGRRLGLHRIGPGRYMLPASIPAGVHFVRAGETWTKVTLVD